MTRYMLTRYMRSAAVAIAALFLVATAAAAAPILQVTGGILTGAKGVDVGGSLYDVEFLDGTCVSLFSGCDDASDIAFQTDAEAFAASAALMAQVFVDGPLGNFDADSALTRGCLGDCHILTPSVILNGFLTTREARNFSDESFDGSGGGGFFHSDLFDTSDYGDHVYARWTPSASTVPVPEPTSLSLLGVGLVGLAARWRRQGHACRRP